MLNQADTAPPDPREVELVNEMRLDTMEYIFGRGFDPIVKAMRKSENTPQTMASAAYKAVLQSAEKHKQTARIEMDMDMMMGVATEAIDMLTEVAEAAGQVQDGANIPRLKEDTLLRMTVMHGQTLKRTPEQKQQAMTDLRDYVNSPGAQKAFDYVNERAKAEGLNPRDMVRQGNDMLFGTQKPMMDTLQAGIKQGLMEQQAAKLPEPAPVQPPVEATPEQGLMPDPQAAVANMRQAPQDAQQTPGGVPYYEDPQEMAQMYPEEPIPAGVTGLPVGGR